MSAFTPVIGALFYVECTRVYERVVGGGMFGDDGTERVVKSRDNSYSEDIFRCLGRDDNVIVALKIAPHPGTSKYVFPRRNWAFSPVGPEVVAAFRLGDAP